jgi:aspartate carbamoyltransferase catalytic subunit
MTTILQDKDILRTDTLTDEELELILATAARFEERLDGGAWLENMAGQVMAAMFFEPSTRTRLSFEAAMHRLGGDVITIADPKTSSAAKGESMVDAVKVVEGYADVIVMRHPREGSAKEAADGLTVALAGDLKNGRTVHSLVYLLARFDARLIFVSPAQLEMPAGITSDLVGQGVSVTETEDLAEAMRESDVVYITRIQEERFEDRAEYERLKGAYVLDMAMVEQAKEGITIMHPLPRVNEIKEGVDAYAGAAYFRQAHNGVPVRMALLALVTGRE